MPDDFCKEVKQLALKPNKSIDMSMIEALVKIADRKDENTRKTDAEMIEENRKAPPGKLLFPAEAIPSKRGKRYE